MTCHQSQSILDDYADQALGTDDTEVVRSHLEQCSECRRRLSQVQQLKELLGNQQRPNPGEPYFDEVTRLILARTVEAESVQRSTLPDREVAREANSSSDERYSHDRNNTADRITSLTRSMISAAASIAILIGALWLGSGESFVLLKEHANQDALVTPTVAAKLPGTERPVFASRDEKRLAGGIALIGPVGMLGRFTDLSDFSAVR